MFGLDNFWDKPLSCKFKIVKNALEQIIPNRLPKHVIAGTNTYLLTFTVKNFASRIVLIKTLFKFRTIAYWFTLHLHMYVLG